MKSWKHVIIYWDLWSYSEINSVSNWCWSSRGIFRPPWAKKNKKPCNKHDVRYLYGWGILDKMIADTLLWLEIIYENLTNFWWYGIWNLIWVWVFWTLIDFVALFILWKESAFAFWPKRTKEQILHLKYKHEYIS